MKNKICNHLGAPLVIINVKPEAMCYIRYTLKCLSCGEEFTVIKPASKKQEYGFVGKTLRHYPYVAPCDWEYEAIKEAYDLMAEQCRKNHIFYGNYYLASILRQSFGSDLDRE